LRRLGIFDIVPVAVLDLPHQVAARVIDVIHARSRGWMPNSSISRVSTFQMSVRAENLACFKAPADPVCWRIASPSRPAVPAHDGQALASRATKSNNLPMRILARATAVRLMSAQTRF